MKADNKSYGSHTEINKPLVSVVVLLYNRKNDVINNIEVLFWQIYDR